MTKVNDKNKTLIKVEEQSPAALIRQAVAGGADLEKLKGLMELQERWDANQAKKAYNGDMVLVHKNIPLVAKTLKNTQTSSNYAALDEIICKTKAIYTEQGFSVSFYEGTTEKTECVRIMADVVHKLGHKETYHYDVPLDGKGIKGNTNMTPIHGKGSSTSYARRYLMCMIFNIPTGDDNDAQMTNVKFIDKAQLSNFIGLIADLGVNEVAFCKFMKVEKLEDIPASDYQKAIVALEAKRAREGQAK